MGLRMGHGNGPGRPGTRVFSRVLGLGFGCCMAVIVFGAGMNLLSHPPEGEHFRAGSEAFKTGRVEEARDHFLAELEDEGSFFSSATYHNLGLISLQDAIAESGADPLASAQQAVRYLEESLALEPGTEGTAWNLELALRQRAKLTSAGAPGPDSTPGQQSASARADTRSEGIQESEGNMDGGRESAQDLSVDAARRLLASFRLMEKSSSREALRSLLRSGSGTTSLGRRGPPW